eukprot:TRINITY_DN680_c1_g3_i2.p1 TRINITY_DN680_c1_g3~~TRINITY_DN680_c1_g3_i2.p1  ORF type:complete len:422 (-),score=45.19 TRINITY_DN680_c1_g3_i2:64-1197(-)
MEHAFPHDELKPMSCVGRSPSEQRGTLDDVLGDYSLTLVDSLDTLLVFNDAAQFEDSVKKVMAHVSFNKGVTVSVFECTIRVLGGLLSAHVMIQDQGILDWYNGELLEMAIDLADRLLPAFKTVTGIPYSRVNLITGVPRGEKPSTCTACAGTLMLEFGLLSRLTGNSKYEDAAKRATQALWERRSSLGLLGNTINTHTGEWQDKDSGIGAGLDSFYEYLFKSYVYFNDSNYHYEMFDEIYNNVEQYINYDDWYLQVDMHTGRRTRTWTDSLGAFWPGLQVSIGDIQGARKTHANYMKLWDRYGSVPERFDIQNGDIQSGFHYYPLRYFDFLISFIDSLIFSFSLFIPCDANSLRSLHFLMPFGFPLFIFSIFFSSL